MLQFESNISSLYRPSFYRWLFETMANLVAPGFFEEPRILLVPGRSKEPY